VAQTLIPHVIIGGTIRDKTKATLPSVVVFGVVELKKLGILKLLLRDKVSMVDVTSRYFPVDSFVGRANLCEVEIQPKSVIVIDLNFHGTIKGEHTRTNTYVDQIQSGVDYSIRNCHLFIFAWWAVHQVDCFI
jgi:hypothetical protein